MEAAEGTSLDLTIGDSVPLTGDLADFGPPGQKAADIAISEVITPAIEEVGADHTVERSHEDNAAATTSSAPSRRPASSSIRRGDLHRRRLGVRRHDPDGRVGHDPARRSS